MSPYAFYVWAAYAVSLAGLAALTAFALGAFLKARRNLADLEARKPH